MKRIRFDDHGDAKKMMEKYGCSRSTLDNALRFIYNSEQSKRIREDALENFSGRIVTTKRKKNKV